MSLTTPLVCTSTAILFRDEIVMGYKLPRIDALGRGIEGGWTVPGGKVKLREQLDESAAREVFEETGIEIEPWKLKLFSIHRMDDFVTFCYYVRVRERLRPQDKEPRKEVNWRWFKFDRLIEAGSDRGHTMLAAQPYGRLKEVGVPYPLFPPTYEVFFNGRRTREMRKPGAPTHCMVCLGRLPCVCFTRPDLQEVQGG